MTFNIIGGNFFWVFFGTQTHKEKTFFPGFRARKPNKLLAIFFECSNAPLSVEKQNSLGFGVGI